MLIKEYECSRYVWNCSHPLLCGESGVNGAGTQPDRNHESLTSPRLVILTLVWSWIIGPLLAILIIQFLPLSEAHGAGLLLFSLAPTAPMLPILIRKAKADMDISAAMMPLAVVGTVILMPLLAPVLIPGVSVSSMALAKQLVLTVLLPLVAGVLIMVYAKKPERLFSLL